MRKLLLSLPSLWLCLCATAQEIAIDTTLQEVVVQAYVADRPIHEVPAAVAYISPRDLQRYNNTSILPAVNTIPGVRMEERSPGSYRFSIRGSSLRSPFGVRNVKVYWNGLPFTDAGGNTYLNLIDFGSVGSIEVIKGPGGSLYGAGSGGVILLGCPIVTDDQVSVSSVVGSYGTLRTVLAGQIHNDQINARMQIANQKSDGYREQAAMNRTTLNADFNYRLSARSILSATLIHSDLFYETPGALTKAQLNEDPRQARPATPTLPGAVEAKAAVYNMTDFVGLGHHFQLNNNWSTHNYLYLSGTDFENPTIRNYEVREETNFGARSETKYAFGKNTWKGNVTLGAEFQQMNSPIDVFANNAGQAGAALTNDDLSSRMLLFFGQTNFDIGKSLIVTLGASLNFVNVGFEQTYPNTVKETRKFDPVISPRIAALAKLTDDFSAYGSFSQGFSTPTIAELYPSRQIFDSNLNPEHGNNIELGVKGDVIRNKLYTDITVYNFRLKETIVMRRDASIAGDPEYYVNAGNTNQRGIEASVNWNVFTNPGTIVSNVRLSGSYAYNHYRFDNYSQGADDHSGNKLTGVPVTVGFLGADITGFKSFYLNITGNYVDHIPLNDANTEFAPEYVLVGARLGYKTSIASKHVLDVFTGVDNALDERYSLGNDLNAVGGRYYNTAMPRNFYAGVKFDLSFRKM